MGSGDFLTAAVLAFDRAGLVAEDLRTETSAMEDAFLALTDAADSVAQTRARIRADG
jgi:hypothetical protein